MKIEFKDYLQKITFSVLEKKFPGNFGKIKDFDDNNIMININDERLFPKVDKDKLTMVTLFNILSYEELISMLSYYEEGTLDKEFGEKFSLLFKEKPKMYVEKKIPLAEQKFVIIGGYLPGKRKYQKNNDILTNAVICSDAFLKDKISILNYSSILSELNKFKNVSLNNELILSFDSFYSRINFKLCLRYKSVYGEKELSNISDSIEIEVYNDSDDLTKNVVKTKKQKMLNLNKYIENN